MTKIVCSRDSRILMSLARIATISTSVVLVQVYIVLYDRPLRKKDTSGTRASLPMSLHPSAKRSTMGVGWERLDFAPVYKNNLKFIIPLYIL